MLRGHLQEIIILPIRLGCVAGKAHGLVFYSFEAGLLLAKA